MAFIDCHFYSDSLGVSASMNVILPQAAQNQIGLASAVYGKKHPTLYLLHGLSDDHTIWMRRTSIERYASQLGIAVVMPAVNRSFYTDMAAGPKYWTFISEELPALARSFFPLAEERELNYVAGLSMGGYGAMKLALTYPERFAAAASLSGALDVVSIASNLPDEFKLIYGDTSKIKGSGNDLFYLAEKLLGKEGKAPQLYQCCGTEDFLYKDNIRFRDYCHELHIDLTYEEEPGEHEWGYWDRKIQNVLNWLPLPDRS
ncbi:S-formylglutathione hydrolase FrmB [Paenibacillus sp. yr247]|uniref:alpha/beta hydrolase n=1 Tax=Paenibacillus sp. yr247 TaxID=1761880 RepID=UPI00088F5E5C|nr:alpha/beta hydrolase family protein [Paenibacillus sp. yr247]SDM86795.1 S-formylglutathione hydrolase FrmB [Paenibacillus sp. yr247]